MSFIKTRNEYVKGQTSKKSSFKSKQELYKYQHEEDMERDKKEKQFKENINNLTNTIINLRNTKKELKDLMILYDTYPKEVPHQILVDLKPTEKRLEVSLHDDIYNEEENRRVLRDAEAVNKTHASAQNISKMRKLEDVIDQLQKDEIKYKNKINDFMLTDETWKSIHNIKNTYVPWVITELKKAGEY